MRTAALLSALLLALLASPLAMASGGHDEGTPEPEEHAEEGVSSPELMPGSTFSYNLTAEGTFDYHCHPHPWMLAKLNVMPSDGNATTHIINITEPADKDFEDWTFAPQALDVRVGDTVTWVNQGTVMHRVTQTVGEHIAHVGTFGGADAGEADVHAEGDAAHATEPSGYWWFAVAGAGAIVVVMWVRDTKKKAP